MTKPTNITEQRFGSLTVLERVGSDSRGKALWLCRCDCGGDKVVVGQLLRNGNVTSCGCGATRHRRHVKHGMSRSKIYSVWTNMKLRCENENDASYPWYGAKGVAVCPEWSSSFQRFYEDMGDPPEGYSLDRIDVEGHYCKGNCKWSTSAEQARNTRSNRHITIGGETKVMADWCSENGIDPSTALKRIKSGWDAAIAVTQPSRHQTQKELHHG